MKKIVLLLITLVMMLSFVACNSDDASVFEPDLSDLPEIEGIDFADEIDNFVEDHFNVHELDVDEKAKHGYELFARDGDGEGYSSDESVATISHKGTITAKGKGTAYVLLKAGNTYKVEKVVVGKSGFSLNNVSDIQDLMFIIFPIFGGIFVIIFVVILVNVLKTMKQQRQYLSNVQKNAAQQNIPQYQAPQYQPPAPYNDLYCPHCGAELDEGNIFCPYCGKKTH